MNEPAIPAAGRKKRIRKGVKLGRRTVNKSEQIRNVAKMMIAEGRPPRPREIVEFLKAKGITVTSGQVSLALKGTSLALRGGPGNMPSRIHLPDPIEAVRKVEVKEICRAKKFISAMGGIEKAIDALVAASIVGAGNAAESPHEGTRTRTRAKAQNGQGTTK
jgi:hypothetical protein